MKSSELTRGVGLVGALLIKIGGGFGLVANAGAPTSGTSGTFAGSFLALPGSILIDTTNKNLYQNTGTKASPVWSRIFAGSAPSVLSANGAINPRVSATYVVTKAGVLADTLAAPTVTTDDGVNITITSNTANAHTVTATGLLQTGGAAVNVATFNAQPGATLELMAYQGKWNVMYANGVSFS